jgi:hypothetical protein
MAPFAASDAEDAASVAATHAGRQTFFSAAYAKVAAKMDPAVLPQGL